tara:strand:+ start:519 stop:872 length:354 start_codon:yes stop_codon:yes gene_type:complete
MKNKLKNYSIDYNSTLNQAIKKIETNTYKTLVVTKKNKIIGILSEGDIIRAIYKNINYISPIKNHMTTDFKFVNKNSETEKVLRYYKKYNITIIPVCDKKFNLKEIILIPEIIKLKI